MTKSEWFKHSALVLQEKSDKKKLELSEVELEIYRLKKLKEKIIKDLEYINSSKLNLIEEIKSNYGEDSYNELTGEIKIKEDKPENENEVR